MINPFRYWRLNMAAPDFFAFGEGTSPIAAAEWALAMTNVDGDDGLTCTVPITDLAVNWDERAGRADVRGDHRGRHRRHHQEAVHPDGTASE